LLAADKRLVVCVVRVRVSVFVRADVVCQCVVRTAVPLRRSGGIACPAR
jgi:hypothetical protein